MSNDKVVPIGLPPIDMTTTLPKITEQQIEDFADALIDEYAKCLKTVADKMKYAKGPDGNYIAPMPSIIEASAGLFEKNLCYFVHMRLWDKNHAYKVIEGVASSMKEAVYETPFYDEMEHSK